MVNKKILLMFYTEFNQHHFKAHIMITQMVNYQIKQNAININLERNTKENNGTYRKKAH